MILAKRTAKGAAVAADRENQTAGVKIDKRLLFNRIERRGRNAAVIAGNNFTVSIFPPLAKPDLAVFQIAFPEADVAFHT